MTSSWYVQELGIVVFDGGGSPNREQGHGGLEIGMVHLAKRLLVDLVIGVRNLGPLLQEGQDGAVAASHVCNIQIAQLCACLVVQGILSALDILDAVSGEQVGKFAHHAVTIEGPEVSCPMERLENEAMQLVEGRARGFRTNHAFCESDHPSRTADTDAFREVFVPIPGA